MMLSCSMSLSAAMKGTRSMSSAKMQPVAHMSTPVEYERAPRRSSGQRYHLCVCGCARWSARTRELSRRGEAGSSEVAEGEGDAPSDDLARHLCRLVGVLARETEIGELEDAVGRDEQVVGLHVLRAGDDEEGQGLSKRLGAERDEGDAPDGGSNSGGKSRGP